MNRTYEIWQIFEKWDGLNSYHKLGKSPQFHHFYELLTCAMEKTYS